VFHNRQGASSNARTRDEKRMRPMQRTTSSSAP
jgi:hypothetical protein